MAPRESRNTRVCVLVLLACIFLPGVVPGQAIDWLAAENTVTLDRSPGSHRLEGMGGLSIAIADENRELNLSDYGQNQAAVLWDTDADRWEFWYRSSDRVDDAYDARHVRRRARATLVEGGGTFSWRHNPRRVLGLQYSLEQLNDTMERGDRSNTQGPLMGAFAGQQLGSFVLGGALHLTNDNQGLTSSNVFGIQHQSSGQQYVGSISYRRGVWTAGVQAERQANTITGISREVARFHEDELTWKRPVTRYSGALVWEPVPALRGAFRARHESIDGRQEVKISWSDRMPDNPGRVNYLTKEGAFDEEARATSFGSRWELRPAGALLVAVAADHERIKSKVTEGVNYKGSRRAEDAEDRVTRLGGGAGYELRHGTVHVGAEGWLTKDRHDTEKLEGTRKVTGRRIELRTGVEWFVKELLALRAGYLRTARDTDTSAPRSLYFGNGFTLGLGYLPRGGLYQLDAFFRLSDLTPEYQGDPSREQTDTALGVSARFLF